MCCLHARHLENLEFAVEQLDAALQAFAGRFDGDRILRKMEEDAKAAIEATKGLTAESYNLSTGFDTSTAAGKAAAEAVDCVAVVVLEPLEAFQLLAEAVGLVLSQVAPDARSSPLPRQC